MNCDWLFQVNDTFAFFLIRHSQDLLVVIDNVKVFAIFLVYLQSSNLACLQYEEVFSFHATWLILQLLDLYDLVDIALHGCTDHMTFINNGPDHVPLEHLVFRLGEHRMRLLFLPSDHVVACLSSFSL